MLIAADLRGDTTDQTTEQMQNTACVHPEATITGPVVIRPDAEVGPGAILGPYASFGANVTVGAGSVVSDSVVSPCERNV